MKRRTLAAAGLAALAAAFVFPVTAAPVAVIESFEQKNVKADAKRISKAVRDAAKLRGWGIKEEKAGRTLLVYPTNNRALKYQATVAVNYGNGFFRVEYVSSRGLKENRNGCYGKEGVVCAHRNVNRWIANLGKDLTRLLMDQ